MRKTLLLATLLIVAFGLIFAQADQTVGNKLTKSSLKADQVQEKADSQLKPQSELTPAELDALAIEAEKQKEAAEQAVIESPKVTTTEFEQKKAEGQIQSTEPQPIPEGVAEMQRAMAAPVVSEKDAYKAEKIRMEEANKQKLAAEAEAKNNQGDLPVILDAKDYCASTYSNMTDDWITNVTFNGINNNSGQGGSDSYEDFTSISTNGSVPGTAYTLSVSFYSAGYTEHVRAWIDWNQDQVFGTDETYYLGSGADATLSTSITIPLTATLGTTRLRVTEQYSTDPGAAGACNGQGSHSSYYGETEDYSVLVGDYVPVYGACCDDITSTCTDGVEQLLCPPPLRFSANTLCANLDPACGDVEGACCFDNGSCQVLSPAACAAASGYYQGDWTDCDPNPCLPVIPWDCYDNPPLDKIGGGDMDTPFEPLNDSCHTTNAFVQCEYAYCGDIDTVGDADYYKLVVPNWGNSDWTTIHFRVYADDTPNIYCYGDSLDSEIWVMYPTCADTVLDNDDGPYPQQPFPSPQGTDSEILYDEVGNLFPPGVTIYIRVSSYSTTAHAGKYLLVINCEPRPTPTGACCVSEVCVATNTLPECDAILGQWFQGETCPEFTCPPEFDWDCNMHPPYDKIGGGDIDTPTEPLNDSCHTTPAIAQCEYAYCGALNYSGGDVADWYTITTPGDGWYSLHVRVFADDTPYQYAYGGGVDPYVAVYSTDCLTQLLYNGDYYGTFPDAVNWDAQIDPTAAGNCFAPGTLLHIKVGSYSTGPYLLIINCIPCEPPVGRCCDYTNPAVPVCTDNILQPDCQGEFEVWNLGLNCTDDPCPALPVGRCCDYTSGPSTPVCTDNVYEQNCQGALFVWTSGLDCTTPCPVPEPGDNCQLPIAITIPAQLPYDDLLQYTCGRTDDYDDPDNLTCMYYYDGGEDIIYEITVTQEIWVDVSLDPKTTTWTGIALDDNCPPDDDCIAYSRLTSAGVHGFQMAHLLPGVYYIMVDTWPTPDCIPDFDLHITGTTTPPVGRCCYGDPTAPNCADVTEADCTTLYSGTWTYGLNCTDDPCPIVPVGRCCYFDEAPPDLANPICAAPVTDAACDALIGAFSGTWIEGITSCITDPCPVPGDFTGVETFDGMLTTFTNYTTIPGSQWEWIGTAGNPPGCAWHDDISGVISDNYLISNGSYIVPNVPDIFFIFDQDCYYSSYYADGNHTVLISTNFAGDPTTATWTELYEGYGGDEWKTEHLSLEAWRGLAVNFAFRYRGDFATNWYVDNINVATWIPPVGRCCYDDPYVPLCVDNITEAACYADPYFGYEWLEAGTCATDICVPAGDTLCPENSLFSQNPTDPTGGWTFGTSEYDLGDGTGYLVYENFSGVVGDVCDIHFWGTSLQYSGGWTPCVENPMDFVITFYPDNAGLPDTANPACVYNLTITGQPLVTLYGGVYVAYEYSATLTPCCTITDGWVSIGGASGTDCWFLWLSYGETGSGFAYQHWLDAGDSLVATDYDLSLCLTPLVEPTGACCVDEVCVATNTASQCAALTGIWHEGEICPTFDCTIPSCFEYLPGDVNMNSGNWPPATIGGDVTYLVGRFRGLPTSVPCLIYNALAPTPEPGACFWASADANGDCKVIGSDVTKLVSVFRGIGSVGYCTHYAPCWPTPGDLPGSAPAGWPNCESPCPPITVTGERAIDAPNAGGK